MYKKAIGIDIDGVIGDSDKIFRKYIHRYFHINLKRENVTEYYYEKILGISKPAMNEFWDFFTQNRFWLEIPLLTNARTSIEYLRNKYEIIIISAREEILREQTELWLQQNGIYYDKLFLVNNGETKISKILQNNINLGAVIEDRLDFALQFAKENIPVYLFNYPWNEKKPQHQNIISIKGWKEILSCI